MGKRDEKFIMILDIDKVFSADELSLVSQSSPGAADDDCQGGSPET